MNEMKRAWKKWVKMFWNEKKPPTDREENIFIYGYVYGANMVLEKEGLVPKTKKKKKRKKR